MRRDSTRSSASHRVRDRSPTWSTVKVAPVPKRRLPNKRLKLTGGDRLKGNRALCPRGHGDRKSTRLNSSHGYISYAVFCLKKKKKKIEHADMTHEDTTQHH